MGQTSTMAATAEQASSSSVVNDFSISVATANGTGSQTANLAIFRALFQMGIPVNGKNIFPSNIQGLPTWYQIRVSGEGYEARRHTNEVLIAFNEVTAQRDLQELPAGAICIYNSDWRSELQRGDVTLYGIPVLQFLREAGVSGRLKDYMANMVYVGALAQLIDIELAAVEEALRNLFKKREKLVRSNFEIVRMAYEWTAENITKVDPYRVKRLDMNQGKIVITGNEAAALGAVYGGVSFVAWYPITPSTSVVDGLNEYLPRLRRDPETGKNQFVVVQAEDELAAIGMVVGAGWAGARAMTATSGPGISLMAEFAGLAYFAEVPAVIWDIQRVGPSTGMPTRTSQGDLSFAYTLGHGDTHHVVLLPATVAECFEFGSTAFDLAEQLQTLVFVLSDLDLGMNNWMSPPFAYPEVPLQRGKVLTAADVAQNGFARYRDIDGDGIAPRTLPGNPHPAAAYFTRGTGHNDAAVYSERSEDWVANLDRLARKFETARRLAPAAIVDHNPDASVGLIAYGSTLYAVEEARDRLAEANVPTSFLRLRALPIGPEVREFVSQHDRVYVIELNRDGQLHAILQTEMPDLATRLHSLSHLDGMPATARQLVEMFQEKENQR